MEQGRAAANDQHNMLPETMTEVAVQKHQSSMQTLPAAVWKRMVFLSLAILFAGLIALDPYYELVMTVCSGIGVAELVWHLITLVLLSWRH